MGSHASADDPFRRNQWYVWLFHGRWNMTVTALTALAAVTAVAFFVVFGLQLSKDGGTAYGAGALPIPSSFPLLTSPSGSRTPQPSHSPAKRQASAPPPVAMRSLTPMPSPSGSRTPAVPAASVRFMTEGQGNGFFQDELTIDNNGTGYIYGWRLVLGLPGDYVLSAVHANPDMDGDFLILRPTDSDPAIPPGGSLDIVIVAQGPTVSPESCTFNGAAC